MSAHGAEDGPERDLSLPIRPQGVSLYGCLRVLCSSGLVSISFSLGLFCLPVSVLSCQLEFPVVKPSGTRSIVTPLTFCDSKDCNPPGSPVHGIL